MEGALTPLDRLKGSVQGSVARGALALPAGVQSRLAGAPVVRDGLTLHHEPLLSLRLQRLMRPPALDELSVGRARRQVAVDALSIAGRPVALPSVEELAIAGGLRARLYVPSGAGAGSLVYFHGGGMVVCDLDTHDALCRVLASAAGVRVVAVDYRLAPEHPFPAAYEDAWTAYRHVLADGGPVAVGGDSAGGNLAAGVALRAAASGEAGVAPALQLLFYPWLDMSRERPSYSLFGEGFYLSRRDMIWYRSHYLPDGADGRDVRCSPLLSDSLSGVAPAYIATAGFDPLRDEGEEYASRLRDAGVPVALRRHAGLVHGFANWLGVGRTGREAVLEAAGALRLALAG